MNVGKEGNWKEKKEMGRKGGGEERERREKEKKILAMKTKQIVKPRNTHTGLDSNTVVTAINLKK